MKDQSTHSPVVPQACAVPYRRQDGQLEFCLITTSEGRWMFPKGIVEPGESVDEAALKEAHEEAGLHGRILGEPLGHYQYTKWERPVNVTVLLMDVTECDDHWDEAHKRQRRWVCAEEAAALLSRAELNDLLDVALTRLQTS